MPPPLRLFEPLPIQRHPPAAALKIIPKNEEFNNLPLPFFANCAGAVKAFNDVRDTYGRTASRVSGQAAQMRCGVEHSGM